ncbi:hypothetical protein AAIM60_18780 [Pseudomonas lijiangensis]|uniref:hypothetical protein n=1 Tax=Pseudomonas lijiangensis TaxID=2995658 RepID=UPI0031BA98AA
MNSDKSDATPDNDKDTLAISPTQAVLTADVARKAEHRSLSALATLAQHTASLEVTRPSITNCPDAGHDIDVRGNIEEIKRLVSTLTTTEVEKLEFLDGSAKNGNIQVRIDVKSGKTVSADMIDSHAANSTRSPTFQVNLLLLTHPDANISKEAQNKIDHYKQIFKEVGVLIDVATPEGLERIENMNKTHELSAVADVNRQSLPIPK